MPKIPAPEDYAYSSPSPSRGMAEVRADGRPNPLGKVISGFGEEMGRMVEEETKKLDELAAQDALNALDKEHLRMTYDPKEGYRNVQGQGILKSQILKTVPEEFNKQIASIASTLKTPRQQELFKLGASRMSNGVQSDLFRHVATQTEKAYDDISKATQANQAQLVQTNPAALGSAIERAIADRMEYFARTGTTDTEIIKVNVDAVKSNLATIALRGFLANDQTEGAAAVLKEYESVLPQTEVGKANDVIKATERFNIASTAASDLLTAYKDGTVTYTQASEALRQTAGGDAKLFAEMQSLFTGSVNAFKVEQDENAGGLQMKFMDNKTAAGMHSIRKSAEFLALDPKTQVRVANFMETELAQAKAQRRGDIQWGWSVEAHNRAAKASAEDRKLQTKEAYIALQEALDDPNLGARKPGFGWSYADKWGTQFARQVEAERARQAGGAKKFDFDKDLMADAIPPDLLKKNKKDDLYAYKGYTTRLLLEWKDANPGKVPTTEEQLAILRSGAKEYVVDRPWYTGGDVTKKAYQMLPMPRDFSSQASAVFSRKTGRQPTQQELLDLWSKQKEAFGK